MTAHEVSLLDALRARTSSQHAALDAAFHGAMTRERYVGFLRASLSVLAALEPAIARWLPAAATPSRVERLRADLAALGHPKDPAEDPAVAEIDIADVAASYGAAYVIEGSTLGGVMLAERFERELGVSATSYLRLRGKDTAKHWRGFVDGLAQAGAAMDGAHRRDACVAAAATFDAYAAAMRAHGVIS